MKKITIILIFLIGFYVSAEAQSKKETQVAKNIEMLTKAMLQPEQHVLESLMSENLSYGHSAGLVQNKAQIIDGLINGPFRFLTIDISDQTIKIVKDIAIVRHKLNCNYTDKTGKGTYEFGILQVWHLEAGQWKMMARQAIRL